MGTAVGRRAPGVLLGCLTALAGLLYPALAGTVLAPFLRCLEA
ncbi:hypothetical protein AB0J38_14165 [Streptomyces sp. NPDC050095]